MEVCNTTRWFWYADSYVLKVAKTLKNMVMRMHLFEQVEEHLRGGVVYKLSKEVGRCWVYDRKYSHVRFRNSGCKFFADFMVEYIKGGLKEKPHSNHKRCLHIWKEGGVYRSLGVNHMS